MGMIYKVGVKKPFICHHFLVGDFGTETHPHKHDYLCVWELSVNKLDNVGFAVNIAKMEAALSQVLTQISGTLLNDLEFFQGRQSSVENVAFYLEEMLRLAIIGLEETLENVISSQVTVFENESAWAGMTRVLGDTL